MVILHFITASSYTDGDDTLSLLIKEALEKNPEIQTAYNRWMASLYRVPQVSSLPNSTFRYTYFGANVETKLGPQEHKYGFSQMIPFPGSCI